MAGRGLVARALESPATALPARGRALVRDLRAPRAADALRAAGDAPRSFVPERAHATERAARTVSAAESGSAADAAPAGFDFARIRIHAGAPAADAARALGARAFAVGDHIVFGSGRFDVGAADGARLLRHEVAHVVQQDGRPAWIARDPLPGAGPRSRAAEVEVLLDRPDPIAGVGDPVAAARLLSDLSMDVLLLTMAELRDHARLDQVRAFVQAPPRLAIALRVAETATAGGVASRPEEWADLRGQVARLDPADRAALIAFLPAAAVPADPVAAPADLTAPPGSPHAALPAPLVAALWRSYSRRNAGIPGSTSNLDNAFWGGRPASFWAALDALGPALPIIRQVYDRWTAAGLHWSLLDDVHNTWGGGSQGFEFTSTDQAALAAALDASTSFCADHVGGAYHWLHGETPCWREVTPGAPGLHFCLGGATPSVHVDPHQPLSGRHDNGYCSYSLGSSMTHFRDLGWLP